MTDIKAEIKIVQASLSDIDSMCGLLAELFSIEPDFKTDSAKQKRALKIMLSCPDSALILIVKHNETPIAMCTAQFLISTAEGGLVALIEDLVVIRKYQAHGIGTLLLEEMQSRCFLRGCNRLSLLADKDNTRALDFYRRNKWAECRMIAMRRFK